MTTARPVAVTAGDDAELVRGAASGSQSAFAAIYDRYADRLFDFCVGLLRDRDAAADCVQDVFVTAASRLAQLREPDRLGSWLYAIARNEALSRIRARRREAPSAVLPERASGEPGPEMLAARTELADLIAEACGGLSDRDRAVYELAYRQGLDGLELAQALGVSHTNANTLVGRLRDSIERSLGALLVCRGAQADPRACPELAALLQHWDGRLTVLMRKRVARHIEGCAVCEQERRRRVSPVALLGSAPLLVPAPGWLREQTLSHTAGIFPPATPSAPPGTHPSPDTPPGAHGGTAGAAAPSSSEAEVSWWPPRDFDTADLADFSAPSNPDVARHNPLPTPSLGAPAAGPSPPEPAVPQTFAATSPGVPAASAVPDQSAQPGPGPDPHPGPIPAAPVRLLPTDSATVHLGGHVRMMLVAVLLLGLIGAVLWGRPLIYRVWPVSAPGAPIAPTLSTTTVTNPPSTTVAAEPTPTETALPTPTGRPVPTRTATVVPTRPGRSTDTSAAPSVRAPQPTPAAPLPTATALPTPAEATPPPPTPAVPAVTAVPHQTIPPLATVTGTAPPSPPSTVVSTPPRLGGSSICQTTTVCAPANNGIR